MINPSMTIRPLASVGLSGVRLIGAATCAALALFGSSSSHGADLGRGDRLGVSFNAPPVIAYVQDNEGRRVGVDFSRSLTSWGEGAELKEIPESRVEQQNIASDDVEDRATQSKPQPDTGWGAIIYNQGDKTYGLIARGITSGIAEFHVGSEGSFRNPAPRIRVKTFMLAAPGIVRVFQITVDRAHQSLTVTRQVSAMALVEDTGIACQQGLMSPVGVCQSLEAKARAAAAAVKRGKIAAAKGSLDALLAELAAQGGKHVKEPALTILREEAEVLLTQMGMGGKVKGHR